MNFFLILSLSLLLIVQVESDNITLVIKKNRRFNTPPYCFAYVRVYNNETDAAVSCYGYEYDCIDIQNTVVIGKNVNFKLSKCATTSEYMEFATKNFQTRLDSIDKSTTTTHVQ